MVEVAQGSPAEAEAPRAGARRPSTVSQTVVNLQHRVAAMPPIVHAAVASETVREPETPLGLNGWQNALKRAFDLASVVVILALFWWAILIVIFGVRLTTGAPVIFSHERVGRNGRTFRCLKFRSMVPNAQEVLDKLLASSPEARAEWERDFKLRDDPRITRFGRFIRKTSLDEMPQLWNVVKGDMSIVGPRPVVADEFERYYAGAERHYKAVRPGLTGPWQVSGRNDLDYANRVKLDREYVEKWSVVRDFMIVMRTVGVMFGGRGAY